MNINLKNKFIKRILNIVQHYNHDSYWRMRAVVINHRNRTPQIIKLWYLFRIKRMDAYNNASMGTDLNQGAIFITPPRLPHGLNGIIISPYAHIGKNCRLFQQVTIGDDGKDKHNTPNIGDNCQIGAGAKLIGKITIGDNVKIGAGTIIVEDIPNNASVVMNKPRIITREGGQ